MKKYLRIGLMMILIILLMLAFLFWRRWMENKLKDDEIEIVQEIALGIPFQWTYTISNDKLLLIKQYNQQKHPWEQLNGGRIEKHYVFKAQSPGESEIIFVFESLVNEDEKSIHVYPIEIDENLHPIVVEKK